MLLSALGSRLSADRAGRTALCTAALAWVAAFALAGVSPLRAQAESRGPTAESAEGYDLWLRYRPIADAVRLREYRTALGGLAMPDSTSTLRTARDEIVRGLRGLGVRGDVAAGVPAGTGTLVVRVVPSAGLGRDGYRLSRTPSGVQLTASADLGALYGSFALLRHLQQHRSLAALAVTSVPRIDRRLLDHWDNLDRTVERGYAGRSLWAWDSLPETIGERYVDYARANASVGINGAVLTNVNANAQVLTPRYLAKVAALADVFRPYGVRVYLTARFSAPREIGGLPTADPLDPRVRAWWAAKADEIWRRIPDFGGFVVKANSEGQPGPQDYGRTHADGANMLADAVAPHGGIVMWRAFVYSHEVPTDRVKQAYDEFHPLDGRFRPNVMVQVKNGPLDFQPAEPFHPLFGATPRTPLALELQITKEYLGQDTHLAYLGPYWEEVLDADTYARGAGTTVARVIAGDRGFPQGAIAGVSNVGTDRDWTGSHFNQANWYAFGRLAWDPTLGARAIAEEWVRQAWSTDPRVVRTVADMMMTSRDAVRRYMTPLGLTHIMATGHHYGPGAWMADAGRADWTPGYYHRADTTGLGFDRTASGSDAVSQYLPPVRRRFASRDSVPESLLLWFHRVRWTDRLRSGRTLWDELVHEYDAGVDSVRAMRRAWSTVRGAVDDARWRDVDRFLDIQEHESRWWRDATLGYFHTFSRQPFPTGHAPPARPFDFYRTLRCPADRDRPRCPELP